MTEHFGCNISMHTINFVHIQMFVYFIFKKKKDLHNNNFEEFSISVLVYFIIKKRTYTTITL